MTEKTKFREGERVIILRDSSEGLDGAYQPGEETEITEVVAGAGMIYYKTPRGLIYEADDLKKAEEKMIANDGPLYFTPSGKSEIKKEESVEMEKKTFKVVFNNGKEQFFYTDKDCTLNLLMEDSLKGEFLAFQDLVIRHEDVKRIEEVDAEPQLVKVNGNGFEVTGTGADFEQWIGELIDKKLEEKEEERQKKVDAMIANVDPEIRFLNGSVNTIDTRNLSTDNIDGPVECTGMSLEELIEESTERIIGKIEEVNKSEEIHLDPR